MEGKSSALIVIDVQNDFCPGGALAVEEGDTVVPVVNRISPLFPRVVATQDWHPPGHVSFASAHPGAGVNEAVEIGGLSQVLWPDHCVQGTEGARFHTSLDTRSFNLIVRKGTDPSLDSYSAFFENDRRTPTGLAFYLEGLGVKELFLCGLATDVCVYHTAMDAVGLGFSTLLVLDATRGVDIPAGSAREALDRMEAAGVVLLESQDLPI